MGALCVLGVTLLACKGGSSGVSSAAPAVEQAPGTVKIAGVGFGSSAEKAEAEAVKNAGSGTQLLTASLSGASVFCIGVAWSTPATSRRALFVVADGPQGTMRSERVDPGASASVCVKDMPPGAYSITISQGPSIAAAPEERLAPIRFSFNQ